MTGQFQEAFLWHRERETVSLTEIHRATGVSLDILKKLTTRDTYTPNVEAGAAIAAYFGKSLESFIRREPAEAGSEFIRLTAQLSEAERRIVLAQIRGILAARGKPEGP